MKVRIAVPAIWYRTREEFELDGLARGPGAVQDAADRRLEDEWRARVARNIALRRARSFTSRRRA